MLHITSSSNPKFKQLQALQKSRERRHSGLCIIEGEKELEMALAGGVVPEQVFFSSRLVTQQQVLNLVNPNNTELIELDHALFEKLSYRESTGGFIAVAKTPLLRLEQLKLSENPLLLVLEGVEKPGNLGAVIRTADAANADAVIICDPLTDIYNPNVIRSSLGTVFTKQVVSCTSDDAIRYLKAEHIAIFCTYLESASFYQDTDFNGPSAIVMGTEATGLTDTWLSVSDRNIKIPMLGKIDSMNVSVAAAIVTFEAKRQRGFK